MLTPAEFRLKVSRFELLCQFELTWGEAQCITARHPYPPNLDQLYQDWQQAYLNFYQTWPLPGQPIQLAQPTPQPAPPPMRAKLVQSGEIKPQLDWRTRLCDAETALLQEFHDWLCQGALREIRKTLTQAACGLEIEWVELFLTCDPSDLVRLPWENWQISDEFTATDKIRLVRVPSSIRSSPAAPRTRWKRARILAICCDDIGLNLNQEKQILKSLEPLVSVQIIGWDNSSQPTSQAPDPANLRQQVLEAITDPAGWDILFFAGHSDETQFTSGRLSIAPNAEITITELQPYLTTAKNHGLQLAIFNSCSGLQIADALIDLGLNDVIVMRERIHSNVAQAFLVQFARSLRAYNDAHAALLEARQCLLNRRLDYPSAYLVPSLFRRPGVPAFALNPPNWRQGLDWLLPKPQESIALLLCLCLSIWPWLQTELLNQRELVQAWYRQLTHQVELYPAPDLALVRIDDASIQQDREGEQIMAGSVFPISQQYMGRLVTALANRNMHVIGIDYVMDDPDPRGAENSMMLAQSIQEATKQGSRFVFAKILNPNSSIWMQTLPEITQGSLEAPAIRSLGDDFHMPLQSNFDPSLSLPFSYWLSWLHRSQVRGEDVPHLPQVYRLPLSERLDALAGRFSLYPMWFHAVTDFSIPPEQIYREIPAWKLLVPNTGSLSDLPLTAIITAGGYPEAGIAQTDNGVGYVENFPPPKAMQHWYGRQPETRYRQMTGGEHLGYLFHHFLRQRFVIPVPNLLMVLLAAAMGKLTLIALQRQHASSSQNMKQTMSSIFVQQDSKNLKNLLYLCTGTVFYILLSLQLYISATAILLPISLPIAIFWAYLLPEISNSRPVAK